MKKTEHEIALEAMMRLSLPELLILYDRTIHNNPYTVIKEKMGGKDFVSHEQIRKIYFSTLSVLRTALGAINVSGTTSDNAEES